MTCIATAKDSSSRYSTKYPANDPPTKRHDDGKRFPKACANRRRNKSASRRRN